MSEKKLWYVSVRDPLLPFDTVVKMHRYYVLAETADDAVSLVQLERHRTIERSNFYVAESRDPNIVTLDTISMKPTEAEKKTARVAEKKRREVAEPHQGEKKR